MLDIYKATLGSGTYFIFLSDGWFFCNDNRSIFLPFQNILIWNLEIPST